MDRMDRSDRRSDRRDRGREALRGIGLRDQAAAGEPPPPTQFGVGQVWLDLVGGRFLTVLEVDRATGRTRYRAHGFCARQDAGAGEGDWEPCAPWEGIWTLATWRREILLRRCVLVEPL